MSDRSTETTARRIRIGPAFLLIFAVVYLLAGTVLVFAVRAQMRSGALQEAQREARIIADRNLAVHQYFTEQLKPPLLDLLSEPIEDGYFDPAWMSSSHAVRQIDGYFDEVSGGDYYIKDAAIDARSPDNEADEFEATFLAELNANPGLRERVQVREIEGVAYYAIMIRGETMSASCLRCHGDPADAPEGLVAIYGSERAFWREEGSVSSAISVRVPLDEAYAAADRSAAVLSVFVLGTLLLGFALVYGASRQLITAPILALREHVIKVDSVRVAEPSPKFEHSALEVAELAEAFDRMTLDIHRQLAVLQDTNRELAQVGRSTDKFLANMSHELRTPLNSILGFAGVMLQGLAGPVTDEQRRQLEMIRKSGTDLLDVIDGVLEFVRVESGVMGLDLATFDLEDLVAEVVSAARPLASEKGLLLLMDNESPRLQVTTDRERVRQILFQLVTNAIKFTEAGSVRVKIVRDAGSANISVGDTGVGIAPETLKEVFSAFVQVPSSDVAKPHGTGLGLSVAQRYARLLGGDLSGESEFGTGSTFTLSVPIETPASVKERAADSPRPTSADEEQ